MKQLLILSGKGGTGKTTIASSFISLLNSTRPVLPTVTSMCQTCI